MQWYNKQLRMVQTVLREPDIVDYDAKAVVDYLEKAKANSIIVNAGGIVDFFQNEIELANPNALMTKENMLGDLVKEAHERNIKVMVRVDFRGVEKARYDKKPHWFSANADGRPKINPQGLYSPCYNSEYANGHAVRYIKNLMSLYDIDGVWENSVGFGTGACYCKTCRDLYKKDTGKEIPVAENYDSPVFDEYREWKAGCADRHIKLLRDTVKSFGEERAFCAEIFGMFHANGAKNTGIDLYNAKKHFDFLVSPAFLTVHNTKSNYDILSYAASSVRFMKSLDKDRQTVLLSGNNGTIWRYVIDPKVESRIWLWEAASVGGGFWNCMFNGQYPGGTYDNRNAYVESDVYHYLADNEEILGTQVPKEDVGIYFSKASRDRFGNDNEDKDGYGVFIKGVERVLVDNHIQYNFIPDMDFSLERIKDLKLLLIPNGACISDEHIDIIKEYVNMGGGIIASYETSLYDEKGKKRDDFGLKELFGCSYTGIEKDTAFDCYQMINAEHPILEGINNTSLLINGGKTLLCTPLEQEKFISVCNYIPIIPNQPPEKAWIKDMKTDFPTITAGTFGKGRVVYFSNQMDKLCHTNGHEDYTTVYYNAIKWAKNTELSLKTNAPDSVHIALTQNNQDEYQNVLSLVNITSAPRRPIKVLQPVYNFYINVRLKGNNLKEFKVLKQDGDIKVTVVKGGEGELIARVEVSVLKEFASIYLKTE